MLPGLYPSEIESEKEIDANLSNEDKNIQKQTVLLSVSTFLIIYGNIFMLYFIYCKF